jgi:release factor glutamine methyltransferase
MVRRRLAGEPLQYVLGSWAFRTLDLTVDPRALIPRPETEQVAGVAIDEARRFAAQSGADAHAGLLVADLGTGTGAIALSMAAELGAEFPDLHVWATDADSDALALATDNVARVIASVPHVATRVSLALGEWYGALPAQLRGRLAVVVSNPPYVSADEYVDLDPVVRCEPHVALVAADGSDGSPGLADVEAVLLGAPVWLAPGGAVVVELAPHQAPSAVEMAVRIGLGDVRVVQDLAGRDRAVAGVARG